MSNPEKPRNIAAAIAFLVIGLLILLPSGLCTGIFGGGAVLSMLLHPNQAEDSITMLVLALVVGGPFVAVGIALTWAGISRFRGK